MMADENSDERRDLTHSQRVGEAPLPEALHTGKLTTKFIHQVWCVIETSIKNSTSNLFRGELSGEFNKSKEGKYWEKCFSDYHFHILNKRHDEIDDATPITVREWLKGILFKGEAHEIITLLEYMLGIRTIPKNLASNLEECFNYSPYFIDRSSKPVCIFSTTSEEMKENTQRALKNIHQSELIGATSHLHKAAQELKNNNFADSIRESIHAVESTVRKIDPEESKNFSGALDSLEKNKMLKHPALKEGFKKLYGYTNDEQGIRHALIDDDAADVGFDEAIFMYGACVSFVDYLASKKRQMKEK